MENGTVFVPRWRQVADDLRSKISLGELAIGEPIPSTAQLQEQYSASSSVVRRAVLELMHVDGILDGKMGDGVYVTSAEVVKPGPVMMVVTLKSGTQIRVKVGDYTIQRNGLQELVGLKWTATEDNTVNLQFLDIKEIAAIHSEH